MHLTTHPLRRADRGARRTDRRVVAAGALGALLLATTAGCGLEPASGTVLGAEPGAIQHYDDLEGVSLTVSAKDFTEQLVLGNMFATVLDAAGADVTNFSNTPGAVGVRNAMLDGSAQVTPEYTGTGWVNYLGNTDPVPGAEEQWRAVADADAANGLTWLRPAPMNNTYAFAIREEAAERLGVTKLSDLAALPPEELTFCVESEFAARDDGFVPMLEAYDLSPDQLAEVVTLDTGVVYTATADGRCNFGEVFTTDGRIPALGLRVLEDDRAFFALYNLSAVIRTDVLDEHPELAEVFDTLSPLITNEVMLDLNSRVDSGGEDPAAVARDWLVEQGLVTE